MEERTIHLRIKVKSLVDEAKSIRQEAKKTEGMVKWGLNHHRTTVVRYHTRLNLLAYGILIGTKYEAMERKCSEPPSFSKVKKIAKSFGGEEEAINAWIEEAEAHLASQK